MKQIKKSICRISNNCAISARTKLDSWFYLYLEWSKVILLNLTVHFFQENNTCSTETNDQQQWNQSIQKSVTFLC